MEGEKETNECKGNPGCDCHFKIGSNYLEVKTQKYLGIVHQEDTKWEASREDRRRKYGGQKGAMTRLMGVEVGLKPDIATSLAEAMVRSSLFYGAEMEEG